MAEAPSIAIFAEAPAQRAYLSQIAKIAGYEISISGTAALMLAAGPNPPKDWQGPLLWLHDAPATDIGDHIRQVKPPVKAGRIIEWLEARRRARSAFPDKIQIGLHELDIGDNIWRSPGQAPVRLTDKETAILAYLYAANGEAVGREDLLRDVWDYVDGVETHTLETHIYRLRQKIESDPSKPAVILTSGDGYRLPV